MSSLDFLGELLFEDDNDPVETKGNTANNDSKDVSDETKSDTSDADDVAVDSGDENDTESDDAEASDDNSDEEDSSNDTSDVDTEVQESPEELQNKANLYDLFDNLYNAHESLLNLFTKILDSDLTSLTDKTYNLITILKSKTIFNVEILDTLLLDKDAYMSKDYKTLLAIYRVLMSDISSFNSSLKLYTNALIAANKNNSKLIKRAKKSAKK